MNLKGGAKPIPSSSQTYTTERNGSCKLGTNISVLKIILLLKAAILVVVRQNSEENVTKSILYHMYRNYQFLPWQNWSLSRWDLNKIVSVSKSMFFEANVCIWLSAHVRIVCLFHRHQWMLRGDFVLHKCYIAIWKYIAVHVSASISGVIHIFILQCA